MGGREGLIDTAVKTAETGKLGTAKQAQLLIEMECLNLLA
jgi:DNA-directed RNA polymerase beta' subunit